MNIENSIRKSALMYHYGIGGLWTNNSDETFIIKAPRYWEWQNGRRGVISEENLRKYLGVNTILFPPGAKDKQIPLIGGTVAIGRFPGWHRCKGWRELSDGRKEPCGSLIKLEHDDKLPLCIHRNCSGYGSFKSFFAPVRFMLICSNGHIDDFPFEEWVHSDKSKNGHDLRYITSSGSGLSGIIVKCETCSSKTSSVQRSMRGALTTDSFSKKGIVCSGNRPWLTDENEECDCDKLVGVQKSSSNLLFPIVRNSIYCPTDDDLSPWIKDWIDTADRRETFKNLLPSFQGQDNPLLEVIKIFSNNMQSENKEELLNSIAEVREYLLPTETQDPFERNGYQGIYQREYNRFLNFSEHQRLDDFTILRPDMNDYNEKFRERIHSIGLLEKLRDTRIYAGFSRIEVTSEGISESIMKCYGENEVIGDIVRGEGIFIDLKEGPILSWASDPEVINRFNILTSEKREELLQKELIGTENESIIYMLLHSLAHAIIGEIATFSGYNTASIKERIYVGSDGKKGEMYGILIHTSDGDSEGSLGGLVRLGKPGIIESIMEQAVKRAKWCSSDPLCSHSVPKGSNGCNLAACHHCLLLPETSCETRNEFLDREFIISENNINLGFYKD